MAFDINTWNKTVKGLIKVIYLSQKTRCRRDNRKMPNYSEIELYNWVLEQDNFIELYNKWAMSNYNKDLKPSIDRINNKMSYSLDNIQLLTWNENFKKGVIENSKDREIKVFQYTKEGVKIAEFDSIKEAIKATNIHQISRVINGKRATAGGYIWKRI